MKDREAVKENTRKLRIRIRAGAKMRLRIVKPATRFMVATG
jgi:hypothetical protein